MEVAQDEEKQTVKQLLQDSFDIGDWKGFNQIVEYISQQNPLADVEVGSIFVDYLASPRSLCDLLETLITQCANKPELMALKISLLSRLTLMKEGIGKPEAQYMPEELEMMRVEEVAEDEVKQTVEQLLQDSFDVGDWKGFNQIVEYISHQNPLAAVEVGSIFVDYLASPRSRCALLETLVTQCANKRELMAMKISLLSKLTLMKEGIGKPVEAQYIPEELAMMRAEDEQDG